MQHVGVYVVGVDEAHCSVAMGKLVIRESSGGQCTSLQDDDADSSLGGLESALGARATHDESYAARAVVEGHPEVPAAVQDVDMDWSLWGSHPQSNLPSLDFCLNVLIEEVSDSRRVAQES